MTEPIDHLVAPVSADSTSQQLEHAIQLIAAGLVRSEMTPVEVDAAIFLLSEGAAVCGGPVEVIDLILVEIYGRFNAFYGPSEVTDYLVQLMTQHLLCTLQHVTE